MYLPFKPICLWVLGWETTFEHTLAYSISNHLYLTLAQLCISLCSAMEVESISTSMVQPWGKLDLHGNSAKHSLAKEGYWPLDPPKAR